MEAAIAYYLNEIIDQTARSPLLERAQRRLDDVWIPLRVVADGEGNSQHNAPPADLDTIAPGLRLVLLQGGPGSGKSCWLQHLASSIAQASRNQLACNVAPDEVALPILIRTAEIACALSDEQGRLRRLQQLDVALPDSATLRPVWRFAAAVLSAVHRHYQPPSPVLQLLWHELTSTDVGRPRLTIALDGLDECPAEQRSRLAIQLREYAAATAARIFVAGRFQAAGDDTLLRAPSGGSDPSWRVLQLLPVTPADAERFITAFFAGDTSGTAERIIEAFHRRPGFAGLATSSPLAMTLLALLCRNLHDAPEAAWALSTPRFCQALLRGLLGEWQTSSECAELVEPKLALMRAVAEHFFPRQYIAADALHAFLHGAPEGYLYRLGAAHPLSRVSARSTRGLPEMLCGDGVLIRAGSDGFTFCHLAFQECLVAEALARRGWPAISEQIDRMSWDFRWQEVLAHLAAFLDDPRPLLEMLMDPARDDILRHRTVLAAYCLEALDQQTREKLGFVAERISRDTEAIRVERSAIDEAPTIEALEALAARLAAGNSPARLSAMVEIARLGIAAVTPAILSGLKEAMLDRNADIRLAAIETITQFGCAAATPEIIVTLGTLLRDADARIRTAAARGIGTLGYATSEEISALATLLQETDARVRAAAAEAIGALRDTVPPEIVAALVKLLSDSDPTVAAAARAALYRMGRGSREGRGETGS